MWDRQGAGRGGCELGLEKGRQRGADASSSAELHAIPPWSAARAALATVEEAEAEGSHVGSPRPCSGDELSQHPSSGDEVGHRA